LRCSSFLRLHDGLSLRHLASKARHLLWAKCLSAAGGR